MEIAELSLHKTLFGRIFIAEKLKAFLMTRPFALAYNLFDIITVFQTNIKLLRKV